MSRENWATLSFTQMTLFSREARAFVLSACLRSSFVRSLSRGTSAWEREALLRRASLTKGQTLFFFFFFFIELKLVFSSGKRLYLLKVGFMGTAIERSLVQEHPRSICLLDIDWKRNLIYWTDAQGHLFHSTGYSGEKRAIWTEHTGELGWLFWIFFPLLSGSKFNQGHHPPTHTHPHAHACR